MDACSSEEKILCGLCTEVAVSSSATSTSRSLHGMCCCVAQSALHPHQMLQVWRECFPHQMLITSSAKSLAPHQVLTQCSKFGSSAESLAQVGSAAPMHPNVATLMQHPCPLPLPHEALKKSPRSGCDAKWHMCKTWALKGALTFCTTEASSTDKRHSGVVISTIHSAKGLEWNTASCALKSLRSTDACEQVFTSQRRIEAGASASCTSYGKSSRP
eukprot:scaffold50521_cov21-Tisochrysis_lutea.AAC.1